MSDHEIFVGLEIHVQLATRTKLFCACSTAFGLAPNAAVCPVCLGHPGALPVANDRAFELAAMLALALGCEVAPVCAFDRKNYAYPDMPKGYQITQRSQPLATGGWVTIDREDASTREICLERIHLEEDAGRLRYDTLARATEIDLNRAGIPLVEIVSRPELHSGAEAVEFVSEVRRIVRALGVGDANLEHGSFRCDATVRVRPIGAEGMGVATEIKNLGSIQDLGLAVHYDARPQLELLAAGRPVPRETLAWDEELAYTRPTRAKEDPADYRFFPEPDLGPIRVDRGFLSQLRGRLAELPRARRERFIRQYGLAASDAAQLGYSPELGRYFEAVVREAETADPRTIAIALLQMVQAYLNEHALGIEDYPLPPEQLAGLLDLVALGRFNQAMARRAHRVMIESGQSAADVALEMGEQITGEDPLSALCRQAIDEHPKPVLSYLAGKHSAINTLVGRVMQISRGQAEARQARNILEDLLKRGVDREA